MEVHGPLFCPKALVLLNSPAPIHRIVPSSLSSPPDFWEVNSYLGTKTGCAAQAWSLPRSCQAVSPVGERDPDPHRHKLVPKKKSLQGWPLAVSASGVLSGSLHGSAPGGKTGSNTVSIAFCLLQQNIMQQSFHQQGCNTRSNSQERLTPAFLASFHISHSRADKAFPITP